MQPIEELRYLILAAQREGSRIFSEALRPLTLTPSQAEVLRVLQDYQPLSLFELGQLLVCETGSPSRLVNGLVEAGLIARAPSQLNGRKVILELTPSGQFKANQIRTIEEGMYASLTEQLPDSSLNEILPLLRKYVAGRPSGNALTRRIVHNTLPGYEPDLQKAE